MSEFKQQSVVAALPWLWAVACLLVSAVARANVSVELMQVPAWVERGATRQSIRPGTLLEPGDIVITGEHSRVMLRLHEGSVLKLGSEARFRIERADVGEDKWASFSGLFQVLRGAFRFTTGVLGAQRPRNVDINIGTFTVGIRGTDIWGRSIDEHDLVCLIEGEVEVSRGAEAVSLSEPLSLYVAPRDSQPEPVRLVDPQQLAAWAEETEPNPDTGVLREDGRWLLHLGASRSAQTAALLVERLRAAGVPAEVDEAQIDDTTWFRVQVRGFVTRAGALAAGAWVSGDQDLAEPWVTQLGN